MYRTLVQLFDDVVKHGGAIVSSGDCSLYEISSAQACGRFHVREDGMGFVRRPKEWVEMAEAAFRAGPGRIRGRSSNKVVLSYEDAPGE